MKRNALFVALAALGLALAPAGRLAAQTPAAHAHHGSHGASHAAGQGAHGGAHDHDAPTPAMLLRHRADLGLTEAQVGRLQGLGADDAAGARAVLTPEQRTRFQQLHRSATNGRSGHHSSHSGGDGSCCEDGECCEGENCCREGADCCRDGGCRDEECCTDGGCCKDGKCSGDMECCRGMDHAQHGAPTAPRP